MTGPKTSLPVEIVFVCTGNICRSPMAEVIAKAKAEEAGLEDNVIFSSCGMGNWHVGQPADKRALAELNQPVTTATPTAQHNLVPSTCAQISSSR